MIGLGVLFAFLLEQIYNAGKIDKFNHFRESLLISGFILFKRILEIDLV